MLLATIHLTYRWARRIAVAIVGASVVIVGVAMIFLPGPAIVVIPAGLAILGLEFAWARRWLRLIRERTTNALSSYTRRRPPPPPPATGGNGAGNGRRDAQGNSTDG